MQFLNRNIACLLLWLLLLPAGLLAQETVDCIDYSGSEPDPRCVYQRLEAGAKGVGLFVVPAEMDAIPANAIPNKDFYVYAPKANSDSVSLTLQNGGDKISHMKVASEEALSTGKTRGIITSCHHSKSPLVVSVHSRGTCFLCTASTFMPRFDSHHGGTWDIPLGKPRGKASMERH